MLNAKQIDTAMKELAQNIVRDAGSDVDIAVIGIRSRAK